LRIERNDEYLTTRSLRNYKLRQMCVPQQCGFDWQEPIGLYEKLQK
jgi:hypothetical protein